MQRCGLADELRSHIMPFAGTRYLGLDGEPIKQLFPVPPPYPLGWPPNATFVQPELEAMLRAASARRPGVRVYTGHSLVDVFARWIRGLGCPVAIVRPDRYVFGAAGTASELRGLVHQVGQHVCRAGAPTGLRGMTS
jgi:2-polyprenyl-6-methoxyphenol hydroxylase-like FAD-dependent oxidoreductase